MRTSGGSRPGAGPRRSALVAAAALALTGCGPGSSGLESPDSPTGDPVLEAEVRAAVESYYAALSARDWDGFADHFWPDATLTTVWRPPGEEAPRVVATTVPDFVAQAPMGPGSREIFEETLLEAEIRVVDGLAQVWARYRARFGDPGEIQEWQGTDAFTLLKHEGRWRIAGLAYAAD